MQLNNIIAIEGTLELVTGLHIGAGNEELHIGGIDNPVLKHPYTNQPYIPGSSLKGKMRSMLEWKAGIVSECEGKPVSAKVLAKLKDDKKQKATLIAQLFGVAGDANDEKIALELGPTRLSFWDCHLTKSWLDERLTQQQSYTEAKSENIIDRIKGVAEHPRQSERVPAGAKFAFKLTIRQLDGDDNQLLETVFSGLKLLELDGIGGSGSRGYGKIKFILDNTEYKAKFEKTPAFA
ncbi:MAG: type III-A CRISPR-associated RAMP protein Csm3 [Moraxellaceae bacterium]|nr:type III-A CRISPR-associated RAMP protein Csm3 [Pseudomonadales bacterium]MCP5175159.1 type III-A CRISPR-associated RAMP protein Csm3 [Moraxellaceae bacterium]MCP5177347.1 type III-A CRISPR-associated RAMP protein Csm3 [Moraxellaceae bacterium]